jgi:hypothetical protein
MVKMALGEREESKGQRDPDIDHLIMDAVFRGDFVTSGHKDGAPEFDLIPQSAWQMGISDHHAGKLVHRHPDSPLPEEYTEISFRGVELQPWLQELAGGGIG